MVVGNLSDDDICTRVALSACALAHRRLLPRVREVRLRRMGVDPTQARKFLDLSHSDELATYVRHLDVMSHCGPRGPTTDNRWTPSLFVKLTASLPRLRALKLDWFDVDPTFARAIALSGCLTTVENLRMLCGSARGIGNFAVLYCCMPALKSVVLHEVSLKDPETRSITAQDEYEVYEPPCIEELVLENGPNSAAYTTELTKGLLRCGLCCKLTVLRFSAIGDNDVRSLHRLLRGVGSQLTELTLGFCNYTGRLDQLCT